MYNVNPPPLAVWAVRVPDCALGGAKQLGDAVLRSRLPGIHRGVVPDAAEARGPNAGRTEKTGGHFWPATSKAKNKSHTKSTKNSE